MALYSIIDMRRAIFPDLGEQLKHARMRRRFTQSDLAKRLGRDRARISELERDLLGNRLGRDRLTLLAEICDALDLVPALVPRAMAQKIQKELEASSGTPPPSEPSSSLFDELFVDLSDDEDDE